MRNPLIDLLIFITGKKAIFPLYHAISDSSLPHIQHLYKIKNRKSFIKDLDFLLKNYTPIDLFDLIDIIKNEKKITRPVFHLTFDDGLSQVYDIIFPVLKKKGIPCTIFINPAFVDNKGLFYRYKASILIDKLKNVNYNNSVNAEIGKLLQTNNKSVNDIKRKILTVKYANSYILDEIADILEVDFYQYLKEYKPYLTEDQIQTLINNHFTFGGHSIDHPLYSELTEKDQIYQTINSIEYLKEKYSVEYKVFSFPFSSHKVIASFFNTIFKSIDLSFDVGRFNQDIYKQNIHRLPMEEKIRNPFILFNLEYVKYLMKLITRNNFVSH